MLLHDAMALPPGMRQTSQGLIVGRCKAARINNIQVYGSDELNLPGPRRDVRIWRPRRAVADRASLASLAHRVITMGHPSDGGVTSATFKRDAIGWTAGRVSVAEDGEHILVDVLLADQSAIAAVTAGHCTDVSCGYNADIDFTPGTTPTGEAFDGVVRSIRYDHLSVVPAGRGKTTRLGDAQPQGVPTMTDKTIVHDGEAITTDAQSAAIIETLQGRLAVASVLDAAGSAQQAMRMAENARRDPATPYGAYMKRLNDAWKSADA